MTQAILLPYFKPPIKPISIENIEICGVSWDALDNELGKNEILPVTIGEFDNIVKMRGFEKSDYDKISWTILRVNNDKNACDYATIFDLVSDNWKYLQKVNDNSRIQLSIFEKNHTQVNSAPVYKLTSKFIRQITAAVKLANENKKVLIALHYWRLSYMQIDNINSLLHCCSCLEALFSLDGEIRLRLALYASTYLNQKKISSYVYRMYGIRNDYIHGNKIPIINDKNIYLSIIAQVLRKAVAQGIPSAVQLDKIIGLTSENT